MFKILIKKLGFLSLSNLFRENADSCDKSSVDRPKEVQQSIGDDFKYSELSSFSSEGYRPREHRGFHKGG